MLIQISHFFMNDNTKSYVTYNHMLDVWNFTYVQISEVIMDVYQGPWNMYYRIYLSVSI